MKRTYYLLLLLCLPFLVQAQNKPGYLDLQPGDWFEMQVTVGPENGPYTPFDPTFLFNRRWCLKYLLLTQAPNGQQQYRITVERAASYEQQGPFPPGDSTTGWVGYDSYYPLYKQGLDKKDPKGAFLLELAANGQIVTLVEDKNYPVKNITLNSYGPRKEVTTYYTFSNAPVTIIDVQDNVHSLMALRTANKKAPLRIPTNEYGYAQLLIGASYPVTGNTLVKGNIGPTQQKEGSIQLEDSTWTFPLNTNGDFSFSLLVKNPQEGHIHLDNHDSQLFLIPGDTLIISGTALQGTAGWNSQLSEEVAALYYYRDRIKPIQMMENLQELFNIQQTATDKFNEIIYRYEGKATPVCLDYYKTAWKYHIAGDQLVFLNVRNYQIDRTHSPFQEIPASITMGMDHMPVALQPYPQNKFYKTYIDELLKYQQAHISFATGGNAGLYSFYDDFFSILSCLKGYPLYYKLSGSLTLELKQNGWTANQRLKPYYEDFIHNCGDSSLTIPLMKDWQLMDRWAPGNYLPTSKLPLANGKTFEVRLQPDKITCLLLDDLGPIEDTGFVSFMKSHPEIHFIFAWMSESHTNAAQRRDSLFRILPNVTSIEVANKGDKNYETYGLRGVGTCNFVVLDKWGRVVEDHIKSYYNEWKELGEVFKTAEKIPHFSATQRANFINIAGWSLGSILLTALIGIWIYRVRVRSIKRAAALKNAIRDLEIKAIRSQMNPHFIFNALNSIQSLINTTQYKAANNYLVKFSLLLRSVLHNAEKNTLPLADELNTIQLYCELEQLRFDFRFEMDLATDVEADLVEIPGMIIQPLVENAILHGIAAKGKAGFLRIKTVKQDATLLISVYDNGAGFPESHTTNGSHKSVGLKLVRDRLKLFSTAAQTGSLHFSNGNGTTALLTIPIEPA